MSEITKNNYDFYFSGIRNVPEKREKLGKNTGNG